MEENEDIIVKVTTNNNSGRQISKSLASRTSTRCRVFFVMTPTKCAAQMYRFGITKTPAKASVDFHHMLFIYYH